MALATRPRQSATVERDVVHRRIWAATWKFIRTKPLGAAGAAIIVLMTLAAIFADLIAPYDAYELNQRLQFRAPTLAHWLGTDEFGRDVLTRLIYGARIALFIGLASSFIGATAGAILGVVSAYLGGKTDLWLQRVMDIVLGSAESTPSWGLMLSGGVSMYAEKAPWLAIFPGLVISLAVFGFNLLGDSLRDALDPKLRHRS